MRHKILASWRSASRRDLLVSATPPLLVVVAAFLVAAHFVDPAPPRKLVLAAAQDEGGAKHFAKRYQDVLARSGIGVDIRNTEGSQASLALLSAGQADVAFVQSGPAQRDADRVVSLGSVAHVPLWIFYRGPPLDDVTGLRGKRIGIGAAGSSTHLLARELLHANAADTAPTELLPLDRAKGIEALQAGAVDALFLVAPAESPAIQKLGRQPGIQLLSLARAEAYTRRFPHLSHLTLPRGVFDLAADVPAHDVSLLAPTANLLARPSLHPSLAWLLLRTAKEIHGGAGLLGKAHAFPALLETGFTPMPEAQRFYEAGMPLTQRLLPFWAANLVDRLWVIVLPFVAVLLPVMRLLPPLYNWRVRSRIYRWYARLKEIELEVEENPDHAALEGMLARLDAIERAVSNLPMPLAYAEHLYVFRGHVDQVRGRILQRLQQPAAVRRAV